MTSTPKVIKDATIPDHAPGDRVWWIIPIEVDLFAFGVEITVRADEPDGAWDRALEKVRRALEAAPDIRIVAKRSEAFNRRAALISYLIERRARRDR